MGIGKEIKKGYVADTSKMESEFKDACEEFGGKIVEEKSSVICDVKGFPLAFAFYPRTKVFVHSVTGNKVRNLSSTKANAIMHFPDELNVIASNDREIRIKKKKNEFEITSEDIIWEDGFRKPITPAVEFFWEKD